MRTLVEILVFFMLFIAVAYLLDILYGLHDLVARTLSYAFQMPVTAIDTSFYANMILVLSIFMFILGIIIRFTRAIRARES